MGNVSLDLSKMQFPGAPITQVIEDTDRRRLTYKVNYSLNEHDTDLELAQAGTSTVRRPLWLCRHAAAFQPLSHRQKCVSRTRPKWIRPACATPHDPQATYSV